MEEGKVKVENVIHLIKSAGQSLGLFNITMTRAMITSHHFKRCVGSVECDDFLTAAAALCLNIKDDADDIDKTSIIDYFWRVCKTEKPNSRSEEFKNLSDSIASMQYFICRMLKFRFQYKLAHEVLTLEPIQRIDNFFLVPFLRELHEREEFRDKWAYFCTVVWRAVNTIYETRRCLDYEASEIAAACISFACSMCDIQFSNVIDWQQALSASANKEKCNQIFTDILLACYKCSH